MNTRQAFTTNRKQFFLIQLLKKRKFENVNRLVSEYLKV